MTKPMLSHEEYAEEDLRAYERLRAHKEPYAMQAFGCELLIYPGVFSPKYFTDSLWFAEQIADLVGTRSLLEIGTGTGIIALCAGLRGASGVGTDINPAAVANARHNFSRYCPHFEARQGDLFEPLKSGEQFDVVLWNHPFFKTRHFDDLLLRAGFDFEYRGLRAYLAGANEFLSPGGDVLLGTGNAAALNQIEIICRELGRKLELLRLAEQPVHPGSVVLNDYRIYAVR